MPCGTGAIFISDRRDSKSTTLRSRVSNQPSGLLLSATGCGSQRLLHALRGVRILLAAAPTTPPCFCRRQRSSLLQIPICRNVKKRWKSLNPYEESKEHGRPQAVKKSPVGSFLVFGCQPIGMSTVVAALLEIFLFDPCGNCNSDDRFPESPLHAA